jgi:hypothetical protein
MILQAVTSDSPGFRYVIGKDASMIMEATKKLCLIESFKTCRRNSFFNFLLIELNFYPKSDFSEFYRHYDNRNMATSGQ